MATGEPHLFVPREGKTKAGEPRLPRRLRGLLGVVAALVLVLGVAASVFGALAWRSYLRAQAERTFTASGQAAAETLSVALQRDIDLGATARTFVETTPTLTNSRFSTWFRLLGTGDTYPGSFGLIYIAKVPRSGLAGFASRAAADPPLGIAMHRRFAIEPPGAAAPYCLTRAGAVQDAARSGLSLTSLAGLLPFIAPDLDYCAMPIGGLLRRSAATGKPAVVSLSSLVTGGPDEAGVPKVPTVLPHLLSRGGLFVTITPAFGAGAPVTMSPRRPLAGWVVGLYQAGGILAAALQGWRKGTAATLSYLNPTGTSARLAATGQRAAGDLRGTFRLAAAGHWNLALAAPPTVTGLPTDDQEAVVLCGGLLVSALLYMLLRVLSRSRARALQLVSERTAQLRHQALHDSLTGLPNRDLIFDRAEQMLARARRDGTDVAALFVDLDQFKDVNDTLGHDAGDEVLRQAGARIASALRETDTVGRLGGDEFVVLVEATDGGPKPEQVADRIATALRVPFLLSEDCHHVAAISASIGIASGFRESGGELLRDADAALYEAKAAPHKSYVVFSPEMREAIAARLELEADLREAMRKGELFLVYQPTFTLNDQWLTGVEALLRWRHPERGLVMPAEFIPTLEATGLIVRVGRFVIEEACRQGAAWASAGHPLTVSVNVSGRQLDREDFVAEVEEALHMSGLDARQLTLEITETALMRDTQRSARRLRELKRIGVNLAIDDFGTGYCSLAYLQQFPVDCLKIDRSFVSRIGSSAEGAALVRAIVQMGRDLNLETLAEGIETRAQLDALLLEECSNGQGFLFARPLEAPAMTKLISDWHRGVAPRRLGDDGGTVLGQVRATSA